MKFKDNRSAHISRPELINALLQDIQRAADMDVFSMKGADVRHFIDETFIDEPHIVMLGILYMNALHAPNGAISSKYIRGILNGYFSNHKIPRS